MVVTPYTIDQFAGEHAFLSNFFPSPVLLDGLTFASVEVAYQAAKTEDIEVRRLFTGLSPRDAKRLGRSLRVREDWEAVKQGLMLRLLRQKFAPGSELARMLLATGHAQLVEGNDWGDQFWGKVRGVGMNHLGEMLMAIRDVQLQMYIA